MLAAAADEVQSMAGVERAGIQGDYAGRLAYIRRHLPKREQAGAIRALKQKRDGDLAALAHRTAAELKGRLAAIRRLRTRQPLDGPS